MSKKFLDNYKKTMSPMSHAEKNDMVSEYAPIIKHIALRIAVRLPSHVELDDLISAGVFGLIDAVEKFNPNKETKFKTYAEIRVKGAILDELRNLDWVPRSVRQKATELSSVYYKLEQELGRAATDEEVAAKLGINMTEFFDLLKNVSGVPMLNLEDMGGRGSDGEKRDILECLAGTKATDPHTLSSINQIKKIIAKAIDDLPEKQRLLVSLYYYEELTMKEVGAVMGITESRVSQIHTKAVLRLKGRLIHFLN